MMGNIYELSRKAPYMTEVISKAIEISVVEHKTKTFKLLLTLCLFTEGLTKESLASVLFPEFLISSDTLQRSLLDRTGKIIQRARVKYRTIGISFKYIKSKKVFVVCFAEGRVREFLHPVSNICAFS